MSSLAARRALALGLCLAAGCRSIGPPHTVQDRFDYAEALSRSWKEQMLLNLVKLRYADAPVFLDVASVISQYALQGQLTAGGQFPGVGGNSASVGGTVQWSDKPTITFLTPITPAAVMDLVQAGWPVDITFRVAVRAVNGIQGGTRNRMIGQAGDPRYPKILDALRRLQRKDGIAVRVEPKGEKEVTLLVIRRLQDEESAADRAWLAETLGLDPQAERYDLVFGAASGSRTEIALQTRSILEILADLSFDVQVPPEHERDGRVGPSLPEEIQKSSSFKVLSGTSRPADAFVAVRYEDHWFWIDDRDFASKRAMSFMLVLIALAETGSPVAPPAITISTGN
jgi:hypothetical protein